MLIKLRVTSGAKNEAVRKISDTHYEISVREKPENNLANARVKDLIARELGVAAGKVRIVKGHHRSSKTISIDVE